MQVGGKSKARTAVRRRFVVSQLAMESEPGTVVTGFLTEEPYAISFVRVDSRVFVVPVLSRCINGL
jgi:hypothetical protein